MPDSGWRIGRSGGGLQLRVLSDAMVEALTPEFTAKLRCMIRAKWPRSRDHEDLLQEALMAAWTAPVGHEMKSARWQCIDYLRRTNRGSRYGVYVRQVNMPVLRAKVDIEGDLIRAESIEWLRTTVEELPNKNRAYIEDVLAGKKTTEIVRDFSREAGYGEDNGWRIYRQAISSLRAAMVVK